MSIFIKTARLWNLETNQPIGTPLHHQDNVNSATFSADGKFLVTSCHDYHLYTWDISAIVNKAGLSSFHVLTNILSPLSWTQNLVSSLLRRQDGSDIQLREVEVPCTAGKPVHFFFSFTVLHHGLFRAEELSCERKANCQLVSTTQYSHYAATQRSNTEHPTVITATISNCYYLDTFCCP
ncbi:hypothetical protein BDR05DRAFT_739515 [Suillus weaverae]|nr:hypothetical protein BDR05DRAFT_739515 [Suillus weaverae]